MSDNGFQQVKVPLPEFVEQIVDRAGNRIIAEIRQERLEVIRVHIDSCPHGKKADVRWAKIVGGAAVAYALVQGGLWAVGQIFR
ncbi:MAG TPA: hypothetical protein VM487_25150 [Phycisphaerae bacterium]|nr:hypothetical protein [Phycisphaerae bacterium]